MDDAVAVAKPRSVWPSNLLVALWATMVGKKVVIAVTGIVLVGFVVAHMLGNLKIFSARRPSTPTRHSCGPWVSRWLPTACCCGSFAWCC